MRPEEEACRAAMNMSTLRAALKRMEDGNEIEINFNNKSEPIIRCIQNDSIISRKNRDDRLPPKLQRKINLKAMQ
jgi:hypothetical protein